MRPSAIVGKAGRGRKHLALDMGGQSRAQSPRVFRPNGPCPASSRVRQLACEREASPAV